MSTVSAKRPHFGVSLDLGHAPVVGDVMQTFRFSEPMTPLGGAITLVSGAAESIRSVDRVWA